MTSRASFTPNVEQVQDKSASRAHVDKKQKPARQARQPKLQVSGAPSSTLSTTRTRDVTAPPVDKTSLSLLSTLSLNDAAVPFSTVVSKCMPKLYGNKSASGYSSVMVQVTYGFDKAHFIKRESGQVLISIRQLNTVFMKLPKTRAYKTSHQALLAKMKASMIKASPAGAGELRQFRQQQYEIFGTKGVKMTTISLVTVQQAETLMLRYKLVHAHGLFSYMANLVPCDSHDDAERRKSARHARLARGAGSVKPSSVWTRGQVEDLAIIQRGNQYYACMSQAQYTFNGVGKAARFKKVKYEIATKKEVETIHAKFSFLSLHHSATLIELDVLVEVMTDAGHKMAACQVERLLTDMQRKTVVDVKTIAIVGLDQGDDKDDNDNNNDNNADAGTFENTVSRLEDDDGFDDEMRKRQQGSNTRAATKSMDMALTLVALASPPIVIPTVTLPTHTSSLATLPTACSSSSNRSLSQTESDMQIETKQQQETKIDHVANAKTDKVDQTAMSHFDDTPMQMVDTTIHNDSHMVDMTVHVPMVQAREPSQNDMHTAAALVQKNVAKYENLPLVVQESEHKDARIYDPAWVTAVCQVLLSTSDTLDTSNTSRQPMSIDQANPLTITIVPTPISDTARSVPELVVAPSTSIAPLVPTPVIVPIVDTTAVPISIPPVVDGRDDLKPIDTRSSSLDKERDFKMQQRQQQVAWNVLMWLSDEYAPDKNIEQHTKEHATEHGVVDHSNTAWSSLEQDTASLSSMDIDFDSMIFPVYSFASAHLNGTVEDKLSEWTPFARTWSNDQDWMMTH